MVGKITVISEVVKGIAKKDGMEWQKLDFVIENDSGYEGRKEIFAFEVFGSEKVEKFLKFNRVGKTVDVEFNIRTNEYEGKYYTRLQAWMVKSVDLEEIVKDIEEVSDAEVLPF